jgi:selenocysteine lyase/cysteine desulfurase
MLRRPQDISMAPSPHDPFVELRRREFSRLDEAGHAYLDYTGSSLYPDSLVRHHADLLRATVLGNPHSMNPASRRSTEGVEAARAAILRHFEADPDEYVVCFTANATAAIKLVGESFAFRGGSHFALSLDNHNSINGIREFALRGGATVTYLPLDQELRLADPLRHLPRIEGTAPSLFAYPAQSNFSGVRHPLEVIEIARERGYAVLLDAAAFVPTHPLSLRQVRPDFVAVSFYKMFGYPTGVGALIARRASLARLQRPWFAGGAVEFVSAAARMHLLSPGAAGFEDGTPNFLAIAAVEDGLAFLSEVGMAHLAAHLARLGEHLLAALTSLRHAGGAPLVRLYGPGGMRERGATFPFNLLDPEGQIVDHDVVVEQAAAAGISLRGGCFCNPGATEVAFGYEPSRLQECLESTMSDFSLARFSSCMDDAPTGAVRASLGIASTREDVDRLVALLQQAGASRRAPHVYPPAEII